MPAIIPEKYHSLLMLNPMTGIIMSYQNVLVYDKVPDLSLLIYPILIAVISLTISVIIFRKASEEMADVL